MKLKIGVKIRNTEELKELILPENKTTTPNRNALMIAQQGSGKTNYIMLMAYLLYKTWKETNNKYGALPIIFAPTFEFMQFESPSKDVNLPPEFDPDGVECIHITFPICDPEENPNLRICSFDFSSLTPRDILGFTDVDKADTYLGAIQKLIEKIKHGYEKGKGKNKVFVPPREFNLDNFIDDVKEDASLKDALYYVFTGMRDRGMFDNERHEKLDLHKLFLEKKPIIIHFGDLDDRERMSGIAGVILKELWNISKIFYNAYLKKQNSLDLTAFEKFLVDNWTVALFMEEAHQILYATKSGGKAIEAKHPAHFWFKKIIALMGRKRGFKYSYIVTQAFMEIFYGIRTKFDDLIMGDAIYPDDKQFLEADLKIRPWHVNMFTKLPRYSWTILDINKYQKRKRRCASKIKVFLSPAGQPA